MRLQWNIDGNGDLLAPHPFEIDESRSPCYYRISNFGDGEWRACLDEDELANGSIEVCIKECNRHALAERRLMRAANLMRELYSLERQQGGSWKTIARINRKRKQLDRLQRMWE